MELLNFISQDAKHFWGTIILLVVVGTIVVEVIKAVRRK